MNPYQISYLIYLVQYIIVIPIGYWLSTVERASLPEKTVLDEIRVEEPKIENVIVAYANDCEEDFMKEMMSENDLNVLYCNNNSNNELCTEKIRDILQDHSLSDEKVDEALRREIPSSDTIAMFVHLSSTKKTKTTTTMGRYRHGWIQSSCDRTQDVKLELNNLMRNENHRFPGLDLSYRLTFSLVTERPERDHIHSWNFQELKREYIDPFLIGIQDVAHVEVRSREMYHIEITSSTNQRNVLKLSDLEGFLGMHDWDFGIKLKENRQKQFHFILYIPERTRRPLLLEKSGAHAFLIPEWGGVSILNEAVTTNHTIMRDHMGTFLFQLRELLGISAQDSSLNDDDKNLRKFAPGVGISTWESDWIRRNQVRVLIENIKRTLKSSINLMEGMSHMNVPAHVSKKMHRSIDLLLNGVKEVKENDNLTRGLFLLRQAMSVANEVYYDHDTVPQEYFVEEHLAAVYLPLLLPLLLPLIVAGWSNFL